MLCKGHPSAPSGACLPSVAPAALPTSSYSCSAARNAALAPTLSPAPSDNADRRRQRKEKHRALVRKPSDLASYYDCAPMQTVEEVAPRYDACCKRTIQMFQMF